MNGVQRNIERVVVNDRLPPTHSDDVRCPTVGVIFSKCIVVDFIHDRSVVGTVTVSIYIGAKTSEGVVPKDSFSSVLTIQCALSVIVS